MKTSLIVSIKVLNCFSFNRLPALQDAPIAQKMIHSSFHCQSDLQQMQHKRDFARTYRLLISVQVQGTSPEVNCICNGNVSVSHMFKKKKKK